MVIKQNRRRGIFTTTPSGKVAHVCFLFISFLHIAISLWQISSELIHW